MGVLSDYEPKEVLRFFEEICSIPHGSENVEKISDYLVNFAKERNLRYRQDDRKNVIIWTEGSEGYENSAPVIIQGHMDMVAVKVPGCEKNLETEGLDLEVSDDGWISAKGTSLGGDDGIAVAFALALLDSNSIAHPPIEFIATVDEEIGMIGADYIDVSDIKGRIFMNIDSEVEGTFIVSCAGGMSSISTIPVETEQKSGTLLHVKMNGFTGGHSGTEIDKGRLNANLVMGRMLNIANNMGYPKMQLVDISGGEKDNAIATFADADLLISEGPSDLIMQAIRNEMDVIKQEYRTVEKGIQLEITVEEKQSVTCFTKASTDCIIALLMNMPDGIQRMNPDMDHMVQTSLNLGIVSTKPEGVVMISALRSSSETEKKYLFEKVRSLVEMAGGKVSVNGNYPGWEYMPESLLRDTMIEAFKEQYGKEPIVEGIHAGLECGLFSSKLPGLDCLAYGPQINDIHTTDEALSIESVGRTWELTKNTLAKLK